MMMRVFYHEDLYHKFRIFSSQILNIDSVFQHLIDIHEILFQYHATCINFTCIHVLSNAKYTIQIWLE